jgi:hypothetical protein
MFADMFLFGVAAGSVCGVGSADGALWRVWREGGICCWRIGRAQRRNWLARRRSAAVCNCAAQSAAVRRSGDAIGATDSGKSDGDFQFGLAARAGKSGGQV